MSSPIRSVRLIHKLEECAESLLSFHRGSQAYLDSVAQRVNLPWEIFQDISRVTLGGVVIWCPKEVNYSENDRMHTGNGLVDLLEADIGQLESRCAIVNELRDSHPEAIWVADKLEVDSRRFDELKVNNGRYQRKLA